MLNTFFADNVYRPDSRNQGVLQAKVTGSMPVDGMGTVTLPDAWPHSRPSSRRTPTRTTRTRRTAGTSMTSRTSARSRPRGHPFAGANCVDPPTRPVNVTGAGPILDAVDNCARRPGLLARLRRGRRGRDPSAVARPDSEARRVVRSIRSVTTDVPARRPAHRRRRTDAGRPDRLHDRPEQGHAEAGRRPEGHRRRGLAGKTDKRSSTRRIARPTPTPGSGNDARTTCTPRSTAAYIPATGAPACGGVRHRRAAREQLPRLLFVGDRQSAARATVSTTTSATTTGTSRTSSPVVRSTQCETQCLRRNEEARSSARPDRLTPEGPRRSPSTPTSTASAT